MNKTIIQNHLIKRGWKYIDNNTLSKGCCSKYRISFINMNVYYQKLNNGQWNTITHDSIENIEIINNRLKIDGMIV
jgi:hypothetical protein